MKKRKFSDLMKQFEHEVNNEEEFNKIINAKYDIIVEDFLSRMTILSKAEVVKNGKLILPRVEITCDHCKLPNCIEVERNLWWGLAKFHEEEQFKVFVEKQILTFLEEKFEDGVASVVARYYPEDTHGETATATIVVDAIVKVKS